MKPLTILPVLLTLLIAALFFAVSAGPAVTGQGSQNQANSFTASKGIQPFMSMNTNVTWSTFYNGWSPLEYNTSTRNNTLNTQLNPNYANPITVNPADLVSNALEGTLAGKEWQNSSNWTTSPTGYTGALNTTRTYGKTTINGQPAIYIEANASKTTYQEFGRGIAISVANLPSSNLAFDYLTISGNVEISAPATTSSGTILIGNSTKTVPIGAYENVGYAGTNGTRTAIQPNSQFFLSVPLSATNLTFTSGTVYVYGTIFMPSTTATTIENMTITGMALSTTAYSLGVNSNSQMIATLTTAHLNQFAPNFKWTKITNNGYTVATSQPLQNVKVSQTAISNGSYIEEVQTQGQFSLPNAPDLSYGSANITEQLNVSSSQVMVLDISGLSYLSTISGKNGTINLLSSVNPTSSTSFLEIVEYTSSQWNTISGPPGFFSVAGVEYYFDEIVLGLTALLGIGGLAAHRKAAQLRRVK